MRRAPGTGSVYRPTWKRAGKVKKARFFWLRYHVHGKLRLEATRCTNRTDAEAILRARLTAIDRGELPVLPATPFDELGTMLLENYRVNGRRSTKRAEQSLAHLKRAFADLDAPQITADRVTAYAAARLDDGAARATVNRELSALKRALRLAQRAGRIGALPYIEMLREANARKGFFEREQLESVMKHLPAPYQLVCLVAYVTGWRVPSEILTRQWRHLDLSARWLRLEPGETKNGAGRQFPLTPELYDALVAHRQSTEALEREHGCRVLWLFYRLAAKKPRPGRKHRAMGAPIRGFRKAWLAACRAAGVPGRLVHDFRRTAVRNLERAGVSRSAAMAMVGHKTESVYRRYAIVAERDLREAGERLAKLR